MISFNLNFILFYLILIQSSSRAKGITKKVAEWRLGDTEEHSERRGSNGGDIITAPSRDNVLLDVPEGSKNNSGNKKGEAHINGDVESSVVGDKGTEKRVEEADKIRESVDKSHTSTALTLNMPGNDQSNLLHTNIIQEIKDGKGREDENMSINTSASTSSRTPAMRTLIVLFDNTYSWYQPKELK